MDFNLDSIKKQPVSDDPELAKVLAGVDGLAEESLQFESLDQPAEVAAAEIAAPAPVAPIVADDDLVAEEVVEPVVAPISVSAPVVGGENLDEIKVHALQDLRPLMTKLDVSAEEKFNIYLLLLRSSDDKTLIEPAYSAARAIEDEVKRANALLDVIKEIDYLNSKG